MDEFQALLGDRSAGFADASLPTWRKLDGVIVATRSTARRSSRPHQPVRDRTDPKNDYLPNNEATREDYIEGFELGGARQLKLIKEQLEPGHAPS